MNTVSIVQRNGLLLTLGIALGACQTSGEDPVPLDPLNPSGSESSDDGDTGDGDSSGDDGGSGGGDPDDGGSDGAGTADGGTAICGDGVPDLDLGEQCDDGNLDELDGCMSDCRTGPTDIGLNPDIFVPIPIRGASGGDFFQDTCLEDQLLIGVSGRSGALVDQLQFQCGDVHLVSSGPGSLEVATTLAQSLDPHGGLGGSEFFLQCGTGEAIVGYGVRSNTYLEEFFLRCAPVRVDNDPKTGALALIFDPPEDSPESGGPDGPTDFTEDCPLGHVATIARGYSDEFMHSIGMNCRPLELY
ncbi:MAG: hypothetical protein K0V04_25245 [Deltaproteobacteria bacterium]|nr:hypothetical protein [Deltaproteobacteria bacterium]